jgi:hypothetical protein
VGRPSQRWSATWRRITADPCGDYQGGSAEAIEFDCEAAQRNIDAVRPGMEMRIVSAKKDFQMEALADWIERLRQTIRPSSQAPPR